MPYKELIITIAITATLYGNVQTGHGIKGRIGILYDPVHHRIVKVYKNTPAAEMGLHAGDIIKHVNDKDIVGPAYTKVNLTVQRGNLIFNIEIERVPREYVNEKEIQSEETNLEIDPQIQPETA